MGQSPLLASKYKEYDKVACYSLPRATREVLANIHPYLYSFQKNYRVWDRHNITAFAIKAVPFPGEAQCLLLTTQRLFTVHAVLLLCKSIMLFHSTDAHT